ncbi:MAG: hypothetical protein CME62_14165 [Halobacteriovoraceae bacterium]|nr:hypothetical protein [Halobacteriovoraceae bacterium]|tara:strand:+ start:6686 stop:7675 length:990 start_codon:yes stop_codon:yes gene_type:complete
MILGKKDKSEPKKLDSDEGVLYSTIMEIKDLWYNPDSEILQRDWTKTCFAEKPETTAELACNYSFIECLLDHDERYKHEEMTSQDYAQYITIAFQLDDNKYTLKLDKNCHEVELPKNIYSAGALGAENQLVWDNYQYQIYIDKYYVSEHEVLLWAKRTKNTELVAKLKKSTRPAFGLSLRERNKYCQDHGKFLLESRVFDAGSFYPSNDQLNFKSEVPWTKSSRHFLKSAQPLSKSDCKDAYVKGCQKFFAWKNKMDIGLTWIGLRHGLGSYPEVFRNTYESAANLKISNLLLPQEHKEHRLGRRGDWREKNFNQLGSEKVAFRCMRLK